MSSKCVQRCVHLLWIAQSLVSLSDILKSLFCLWIIWILIWMVHDSGFPVGLLYGTVICILVHTKDLVVVLSLALLQFNLCFSYLLCDGGIIGILLLQGLEFADGFLPVA